MMVKRIEHEKTVYDVFIERGFIEKVTDEGKVPEILEGRITCYIGFDPTASSFHVGNLVPIMSLAHMQRHGHQPIALVGAGTGLVGDPSGKDEMRQILTYEEINRNAEAQKKQFARFLDFQEGKALLLNNADWLTKLNYIDFLRDIGVHFSVNRMLATESVKIRLETGLSFIEFNYQLLQAYDFWYLFKYHNCLIQMGGSDQWGNIVAGIDLIRRLEGKQAYGITFPLIMTADGRKMGKTEKGAVWLDSQRTSPYEYYQFWINTDDRDVKRFLALFTFLPMEKVEEYGKLKGADLRKAKEVLAFEATKIVHGEEEAEKAKSDSRAVFSISVSGSLNLAGDSVPTTSIEKEKFKEGIPAFKLFETASVCASGSEARRLIEQGGAYINNKRIEKFDDIIKLENFDQNGSVLLRIGKKKHHRIKLKNP
ncbi:MAG: tyrosine--tRNA ligase [Deltaproteobacteria bacterium RBG_19FT_COMBO_46_12]|nr:MAG: tyrosine--tRNA ligase [Deltaproteobacteria bacterium RBG_19FT_COMBO_46_12]